MACGIGAIMALSSVITRPIKVYYPKRDQYSVVVSNCLKEAICEDNLSQYEPVKLLLSGFVNEKNFVPLIRKDVKRFHFGPSSPSESEEHVQEPLNEPFVTGQLAQEKVAFFGSAQIIQICNHETSEAINKSTIND